MKGLGPHNPPPDPPDFGRFMLTLGAGEWFNRRGGATLGTTDVPPAVGAMAIERIRWTNNTILINIMAIPESYRAWNAATPHILFLTHAPDWEVILQSSKASNGFGGAYGRYLAQSASSRSRLGALADGEAVELAFLRDEEGAA